MFEIIDMDVRSEGDDFAIIDGKLPSAKFDAAGSSSLFMVLYST